ncbi:MAG: hypothetical protein UZ12_BCD005000485 [Bacteroidetes bacterium OLB12]|nr:MAG: hypothetical protein UZ12_BCD005000485 [Bacteroidetes bacterium OLB12]
MVCPTQYVVGVNVMAGGGVTAFTVSVMLVAGPSQPLALFWVMKTVRVLAVALLKPRAALVGAVPVVNTVVRLASLYQV